MTLQELTEAIFLYVCKINRVAINGGNLEYSDVRADILTMLETAQTRSKLDAQLSEMFAKIKIPLVLFIDFVLVDSGVNFAMQWHRNSLAKLFGIENENFFFYLSGALEETSLESDQILLFYYACFGLGLEVDAGSEDASGIMSSLLPRIKNRIELNAASRVTQSAYENVNTANMIKPIGGKLSVIVLVFAVFMLSVFGSVIVMYKESSARMSGAIDSINARATAVEAQK